MLALVRFVFSLLVLAVLVWFATMVPLGDHTLWGHLKAIAGTHEAKDFADGTRKEAQKVADKLLDKPDAATAPEPHRHHSK
ncbi:MAG: hypothetical protein ABI321_00810 [Polyangia bacterium]